jgi:WhiB family redox-sensing transcriptional regulator
VSRGPGDLTKFGLTRERDRGPFEVLLIQPPEWTLDALCAQVDPELFYVEKGASTRPAKRVCNGVSGKTDPCPVRAECLLYALSRDEPHGVWGGLSWNERKRLARGAA